MSRNPKIDSRRLLAVIAVAAALSVSSPVFATDAPATATPAPQHAATRDSEPKTGTLIHKPSDVTTLDTIPVYGGASLRPGDSQWTDNDTSAQDLPVVRDQGTGKR